MCFLSLGILSRDFIESVLCAPALSFSTPSLLTNSKFSCTSEILHVLSVLSYFFFFLVCMFYFSSLVSRLWCSAFHFLDLISVTSFFIARISIWLFYISSLLNSSFIFCVVFLISFSSLLSLCFDSLKTLCPLWLFEHSLIISFNSLSGTLSTPHSLEPSLWSCWPLIFRARVFLHWLLYILD